MWLNDLYHALNPIAFTLGPLVVRWYGLAYIAGFLLAGIVIYKVAKHWNCSISLDNLTNVMIGVALGVIIGARLFYVLFYGAGYYLANPLKIFILSEGGMSFHGGLVGALVGGSIASNLVGYNILTMCDLASIGAPLGLFFGRLANFVNGELWGKPTDISWAVMFDTTGGGLVYRHPSQLYEALLEGLVLFCVLLILAKKVPPRPQGTFIGTFLALYGVFRFLVEFVRLPDEQLGYLLGTNWLTMGQCLSVPLIVIGVTLVVYAHKRNKPQVGMVKVLSDKG